MQIFKNKTKKRYLWGALAVITFLSLLFFSLNQLLINQKSDVRLINIAGKQRMLLQKITLHTQLYLDSFGTESAANEKRKRRCVC